MSEDRQELIILESFTDTQVKSWLQSYFSSGKGDPVIPDAQLHPSVYVQKLHNGASIELKCRFERAIVSCLGDWRPKAYTWELLNSLAYAAALIRARSAFAMLANIAERTGLIYAGREAPFKSADLVVGVLAGFSPGDEVKLILESLFFDPNIDPKLAGQMLQGLCSCDRKKFPSYFRRYRDLATRAPGYFAEEFAIGQLLNIVKPPMLAAMWSELSGQDQSYLLDKLSTLAHPNIALDISDQGPALYWIGPEGTTSFPLESPKGFKVADYATVYAGQVKDFSSADLLAHIYAEKLGTI